MSDKRVSLRLPDAMVEELDRIAAELNSTRTALIGTAIESFLQSRQEQSGMLASLDAATADIRESESRLNENVARGFDELRAKLDRIEEWQVQHLFNFLAYVAPSTDPAKAQERGLRRMQVAIKKMQAIQDGTIPSLGTRLRRQNGSVTDPDIAGS